MQTYREKGGRKRREAILDRREANKRVSVSQKHVIHTRYMYMRYIDILKYRYVMREVSEKARGREEEKQVR